MKKNEADYLRILKMHFVNYKMRNRQEFVFDRQRTLIIGENGSGKADIMYALANLDSPPGGTPGNGSNNRKITVKVETGGTCDLIRKYRSVIIISGNDTGSDQAVNDLCARYTLSPTKIKSAKREIFAALLKYKPWKVEAHSDLDTETMATGERMCFNYAYVFAVRKALNIELPVVINSPYGLLDPALRQGLREFLDKQTCQQILLGTESDLQDDKAQYKLTI